MVDGINKLGAVNDIKTTGVNAAKPEGVKLGEFGYGYANNIDSTALQREDRFAGAFPEFDNIDALAYVRLAQKGVQNLDGKRINTNDPTYLSDIAYWQKPETALCEV